MAFQTRKKIHLGVATFISDAFNPFRMETLIYRVRIPSYFCPTVAHGNFLYILRGAIVTEGRPPIKTTGHCHY